MKQKLSPIFENADTILITSPHSLRYFSGFTGGEGFALVFNDGTAVLLTDSRYTEMAEQETENFEIVEISGKYPIKQALSEQLKKHASRIVTFEDTQLTYAQYSVLSKACEAVQWLPLSLRLDDMRMIKEEWELNLLREAEQIGVKAFEHILLYIKEDVAEQDIALELDYFMRKCGAQGNSFETIAVAGKNSSLPHGKPGEYKLKKGDFLTMDFGCVYKGYCSDMTRTVIIGRASDRQKEIYETVRRAQQRGLETIRAGIMGSAADAAARTVIESAGYGEYFGHSLGHGVGLQIHEQPNLSPKSTVILEENMIVTCEPGIYIPDFGGVRIEDMVRVTSDGCENLSEKCTKELLEI